MARQSSSRTLATCAAVLALVTAGCGRSVEPGVDEPAREGLAIDVAGIFYNVFITRPLNLGIEPDRAFYQGPPADPGRQLWGVFIRACNESGGTLEATEDFVVEDNEGKEFEPIDLPEENEWAYHKRRLAKNECIPESGSAADLGPTKASMLLFEFPLEATENRPLELHITGIEHGEPVTKTIELDL